MRTVERTFLIRVEDGAVIFECDGAVAILDASAVQRASGHFLKLAAGTGTRTKGDADFELFATATGERLAACASQAEQQGDAA